MDNNRSIERLLFPCPEVDSSDYSAYPPVSPEEFMVMEQGFRDDSSHVCLSPYARLTKAGKAFIDIYVWDLMLYPYNYRRFIICEGYRLSEEEENAFLKYVRCACHCPSGGAAAPHRGAQGLALQRLRTPAGRGGPAGG